MGGGGGGLKGQDSKQMQGPVSQCPTKNYFKYLVNPFFHNFFSSAVSEILTRVFKVFPDGFNENPRQSQPGLSYESLLISINSLDLMFHLKLT